MLREFAKKTKNLIVCSAEDKVGTCGFNGQSDDAHDLLKYLPQHWQVSLAQFAADATVTVADPDHTGAKE